MAKMAAVPKTQEWWNIMKPMQQPLDSRNDDEWGTFFSFEEGSNIVKNIFDTGIECDTGKINGPFPLCLLTRIRH